MNTTTTINGLDPKFVAREKHEAAMAERLRMEKLRAMRLPGLETIIDEAIEQGHSPDEVALACCKALKDKNESDAWIASFKRDASSAAKVPACEAPFKEKKLGEEEETPVNKSIVKGFRKLRE